MIQPPGQEAVFYKNKTVLLTNESKDRCTEGEYGCQHTKEGHAGQEVAQTEAQEEQQRTPTSNGTRHIHMTLSY
jgi:hypothetical protein